MRVNDLWNNLPAALKHIRNKTVFKTKMKTHLLNDCEFYKKNKRIHPNEREGERERGGGGGGGFFFFFKYTQMERD